MRKATVAWLAAAGVLLLFALATLSLPSLFGVVGKRALILRLALVLFGLAATVLTLVLALRRARNEPPPAAEGEDDIDLAFAGAQARLRGSHAAADSRIARMPLVLVLGPTGTTKSSIVTNSGIDAELLHGEVFRGDAVIPTNPVNVWYAQGKVLVEAGGGLLDDSGRWTRLLSHLRASRVAAAVGRGRQAPRVVVVCFGCDELVKPGASETVTAAARRLRARLSEVSQELGIRLPVYVIFTRADKLPGFPEYVRNFTTDEAQQVLGATLPLMPDGEAAWAEAQARRLQEALGRLVQSLANGRLDVLERETREPARGPAYEFPRELSKISELATQFLVDLCRPSQLGLNPFLRGFYFVGVRPIVLRDAAIEAPVARVGAPASGATSVFNAGSVAQRGPAAAFGGGERRVPQWTFLRRLFPDVVFADGTALKLTGAGTRVDFLRRALIAAAAGVYMVASLGMTVSYARNRKLVKTSVAAAAQARQVGGVAGIVGEGDLTRLDALRERTEQVLEFQRNGHPLSFGWGLYVGDQLDSLMRRVYFDRFDRAIWNDTQTRLMQYLRALPEQPTEDSDFGRAQDALAAHLLTTSEYGRATPELLAPVLMSHTRDLGTDSARTLAQRQFAFFAAELPHESRHRPSDGPLVERTQRFLRAFGTEAYYRALVYEGNRADAARYSGQMTAVRNDAVVPGAFTLAGRKSVEKQLDNVDSLFVRYQWIYGSQPPTDKPNRENLRRQYIADYVKRWQDYLAAGNVARFSSPGDAATKLGILGSSVSPLFAMLNVASKQTADDSTSVIGKAFQPLHRTVPPNADANGITASALNYANAVSALGTQLNVLATATGPARDQGIPAASTAAANVKREAATLGAGFAMTGDAAITAAQIRRLLGQPAEFAESLVTGLPANDLNAAGRSFCAIYDPIVRKFPFNARGLDATPDEVNGMFQKDDGLLSAFYKERLDKLLMPQGRPRPDARVNRDFARFFERAVDVTGSLYHGTQMSVSFDFLPSIPPGAAQVTLQVGGTQKVFTLTATRSQQLTWEAERKGDAKLVVTFGTQPVVVATGSGVWAPFKLMQAATWTGPGPFRLEWPIPGRNTTLTADVSFEAGVRPVFRPGYFSGVSPCVSQIVN